MRRVLTNNCEYMQAQSGPGRVVDILEACGAFDPGSSPGRGAFVLLGSKPYLFQIANIGFFL